MASPWSHGEAPSGERFYHAHAVRNDPPDIIFSTEPSVLVLVDGPPVLDPVGASGVERVLNSRSLLLKHGGRLHLSMGGHWTSATSLGGPWTPEAEPDTAVVAAARQVLDAGRVDAALGTLEHAVLDSLPRTSTGKVQRRVLAAARPRAPAAVSSPRAWPPSR